MGNRGCLNSTSIMWVTGDLLHRCLHVVLLVRAIDGPGWEKSTRNMNVWLLWYFVLMLTEPEPPCERCIRPDVVAHSLNGKVFDFKQPRWWCAVLFQTCCIRCQSVLLNMNNWTCASRSEAILFLPSLCELDRAHFFYLFIFYYSFKSSCADAGLTVDSVCVTWLQQRPCEWLVLIHSNLSALLGLNELRCH